MKNTLALPFNTHDPNTASVFDEAPLWSVPFGLLILEHIKMKKNAAILDVGCGAGFPLIETAQRAGSGSVVYGIDPWRAGLERLRYKASFMKVKNIKLYERKAEKLPFKDSFFDIIISNNGLNNVEDPRLVLKECFRTAKPGAQLLFTANLPNTMKIFYQSLEEVFLSTQTGNPKDIQKHITHKRKSIKENIKLVNDSGFIINKVYKDSFKYRFVDGTAFLNHYFIRIAFMESWENLVPKEKRKFVFSLVETSLNKIAKENNGLTLNIPFACYDCLKP